MTSGFDRWLVSVSAGNPAIIVYRQHCAPATARPPLSAGGLTGGLVSQLEEKYDCRTPRRVLVRVRGVFRSPASLRKGRFTQRPVYMATGAVRASYLAIRTQAGRPLIYAETRESRKARLFTARSCFRD